MASACCGSKTYGVVEEILLMSKPDQFHFVGITHPGLFQALAEDAVDQTHCRKILDTREACSGNLVQKEDQRRYSGGPERASSREGTKRISAQSSSVQLAVMAARTAAHFRFCQRATLLWSNTAGLQL
jgi:hypothetical protein